MPNVAFKRPELREKLEQYQLVADAIAGSIAVKAKEQTYLPKPNAEIHSLENNLRYRAYLRRAVFYNVTNRTMKGLSGQMFMRDPVVEMPEAMKPLQDDATGEGVELIQLAKRAANWVTAYGRAGLFTDYPATNGATTQEDIEKLGIRPTIKAYEAWRIINWRHRRRGALSVLSLVVLEEDYIESDDGFEVKLGTQWRVLSLSPDDVYSVQVWRKTGADLFRPVSSVVPTNASGATLKDIPFCFIGAENNDSDVDPVPLFDLADVNLSHYRNSADYEESCFLVGQPTPVFVGLTESWVKTHFKDGVGLGSRASVPLPVGGDAKLLQADPNTMTFENMQAKERQMVALGAKLVEQKTVQRTATEAGLEEAAESSVLASIANNVSLAFVWAIGWAAQYQGVPETGIVFKIGTDFDLAKMSPEERKQTIAEWQGEAITFSEMRAKLRASGVATLDDKTALAEIKAAEPTMAARAFIEGDDEPEDEDDEPEAQAA